MLKIKQPVQNDFSKILPFENVWGRDTEFILNLKTVNICSQHKISCFI